MKLSSLLTAAAFVLLPSLSCQAAVTIMFNRPFEGGMSSNLADRDGTVTNGMFYGIIVDTTGNGFQHDYLNGSFSFGQVTQLQSVTSPSDPTPILTDDILIMANDLTFDTSLGGQLTEGDGSTFGGNGGAFGLSFDLTGGLQAGARFELIWFRYLYQYGVGFLRDEGFVLPTEGDVGYCDQVFTGVDPVRPSSDQTVFHTIPEPGSALLGLIGVTALLRRWR